jgi:hypothetical protein
MRYRSWLLLTLLVSTVVVMAGPAAAQSGGYGNSDQAQMMSTMGASLAPEPHHRPAQWLDVGISLPIAEFNSRGWDPGFTLRWSHEFLQRDSYSILGSLGFNWNNETHFNEAQTNQNFQRPLGTQQGPVESLKWWGVPYSFELQWEPTGTKPNSFFVSLGPAGQVTRESKVLQESVLFSAEGGDSLVVPIIIQGEALSATQAINKTKFNPGYVVHAGFRGRVGGGKNPLYMRIIGGWNVWYERGAPISLITAALSFGR